MPVIKGSIWAAYLFLVSAGLLSREDALHRMEVFRLIAAAGISIDAQPEVGFAAHGVQGAQEFFDRCGIKDDEFVVGMSPMSSTPLRRWRHYGVLAKRIQQDFKAKVILFGAKGEADAVDRIAEEAGDGVLKATDLNLQEFMAAVCGCDLFITNDTGPMHLACITGRPVIALFGPTSPAEVGPWNSEYCVLQSSLCRGCYKQACSHPDVYCMDQIRVEDVLGALAGSIRRTPLPMASGTLTIRRSSTERETKTCRTGSALLEGWFRIKGGYPDELPMGFLSSAGEGEAALEQCVSLEVLAWKALGCLWGSSDGATREWEAFHRVIARTDEPLRVLVMVNEMIALEQRRGLSSGSREYQAFYEGLLRDIDLLKKCLLISQKPQSG
jgi:hypothetical protein